MMPTPPLDISRLTEQQRDIVVLILNGLTNREIADRLGLTPGAVGVQVGRILSRLGLGSRAEVMALGLGGEPPP